MNYFRIIYSGLTETKVKDDKADGGYVVFTEGVKETTLPMEGIYYFPDANYDASLEAILSLMQDDGFVKISPTEWIPFSRVISVKSVPNANISGTKNSQQSFTNNKKEFNQDGRERRDNFKRKFKRNDQRDVSVKEAKPETQVIKPTPEETNIPEETEDLSPVDWIDNVDGFMDNEKTETNETNNEK